MIEHVHAIAHHAGALSVTVATDDQETFDVCQSFGAQVHMTRADHDSGTDRIAECAQAIGLADSDIVVNLQGDEPLTPPAVLQLVAQTLVDQSAASIATLATRIVDAQQLHSPDVVKVVVDRDGYALYFSRAPIPYHRELFSEGRFELPPGYNYLRHIGIYAYRIGFLNEVTSHPPSPAEKAERLEQLRTMHMGRKIAVAVTTELIEAGVDTVQDLARVEASLQQRMTADG